MEYILFAIALALFVLAVFETYFKVRGIEKRFSKLEAYIREFAHDAEHDAQQIKTRLTNGMQRDNHMLHELEVIKKAVYPKKVVKHGAKK